ncbi:helix-turn-helix transcriptional regulator [Psychrobacter immobilis]|uniref:helix-turn-helix transcriptional regulator n=1 Tax=Psychrobacter immobilis TaxID=498 RepID=UPI003FCFE7F5
MKYVFDKQLEMINDWCMVKNVQRFNQLSQIIYIDKSIGDGYFERYDFGSIGLSRVNCYFHRNHQFINPNCQTSYVLYIVLQGSYEYQLDDKVTIEEKIGVKATVKTEVGTEARQVNRTKLKQFEQVTINAPAIWLIKGDLGRLSTIISAKEDIKALYIELDKDFVGKLATQIEQQTDANNLIISKLMTMSDSSILPLNLTTKAANFVMQGWEVYNTPSPTDDIKFMALQGQCLTFTSLLLKQCITEIGGAKVQALNSAYQAKLLLDEFYNKNWTIRELAQKTGTNECHLKADFKKLTTRTIGDYRTHKRMQLAMKLLQERQKIAPIANQLGFSSTQYFRRVFYKFYGYMPELIYDKLI